MARSTHCQSRSASRPRSTSGRAQSAADRLPYRAVVAVRNRPEETEAELMTLVDLGVRVVDIVEHPLCLELNLASPTDVRAWAEATPSLGDALPVRAD